MVVKLCWEVHIFLQHNFWHAQWDPFTFSSPIIKCLMFLLTCVCHRLTKPDTMAPQVTIFFHKIETTKNACTKQVGFRKTFVVGESLDKCVVPKPIQRARPQVTPKVVKTQLKKTLSKNALRNSRKRAAHALRKKEAKRQSIEAILSEFSRTSSMAYVSKNTSSTLTVMTPKKSNTTRLVQIMIGSILVNLFPTDSVLMTSTNETSEESQKDNSLENIEV